MSKRITLIALLLSAVLISACGNQSSQPAADKPETPDSLMGENTPKTEHPDQHNAANALDVAGTYKGILPCADCSGIDMEIVLNTNGTYVLKTVYLGKKELTTNEFSGKYLWNTAGNTITLEGVEKPNTYFVGENYLAKLDMNGERISGELAPKYILKKN